MKKAVVGFILFLLVIPTEIAFLKASYTDENRITASPQAKETEGFKKKKSVVGKIAMWTLHVVAIGSLAWYFFINPNSPLKNKENGSTTPTQTEKGDYQNVTLKVTSKVKGINVGRWEEEQFGVILCILDDQKVEELCLQSFSITDLPGPNSNCTNALTILDRSKEIVFTKNKIKLKFQFAAAQLNNLHDSFFCADDFSITPVAYTYEPGKADPGMPVLIGSENLVLQKNEYTLVGRKHYSYTTPDVYIYFVKPDGV